MISVNVLANEISASLAGDGFRFEREVVLGGLRLDFLVHLPDGRRVVLEARSWSRGIATLRRARMLARHLLAATKVDEAYVVLPDAPRKAHERGVLGLRQLPQMAAAWTEPDASAPREELPSYRSRPSVGLARQSPSPQQSKVPAISIFAVMPFQPQFDDVFYVAIAGAASRVGGVAVRADLEEYTGDIITKIHTLIRHSSVVVADLTGASPNVLYEVGIAHALSIPTVHICGDELKGLPFDVRNWNTIAYKPGQTHRLLEALAQRITALTREANA